LAFLFDVILNYNKVLYWMSVNLSRIIKIFQLSMLEDVLRRIKPIFIEKNMKKTWKKRGLSSYFISHFLRSKTGKMGPSASCSAFNSLQNPIYGYAWEFNFSDHIFIRNGLVVFRIYYDQDIDKTMIYYSQNVATITTNPMIYNTYK
jgi:hypothetical protein